MRRDQLLIDHQLIEAIRADLIDDNHPDPIARILLRWRADISVDT